MRRSYPELELTWVLDHRFAPLFIDEQGHNLVPLIKLDFSKGLIAARSQLKETLKTLNQHLPKSTFTALLNMQTSLKASLCSTVIKAHDKYGYDAARSREGQRFFINKTIAAVDNPHVMAGFMAFAAASGYPIAEPSWDFKLDPYLIDRAYCMVSHERVFAICPCSAQVAKNWSVEGYVALAKYALEHEMGVILLGGKNKIEMETCQAITEQCPSCLNLCGKTNLRELAALLSISKLVLAPDSGSMHLASALGTPVIGLFARHHAERVGPWNFMDLNVSVYEKLAQQELKGKEIPWRYRVRTPDAMKHITVDQVIATFDRACSRYHI